MGVKNNDKPPRLRDLAASVWHLWYLLVFKGGIWAIIRGRYVLWRIERDVARAKAKRERHPEGKDSGHPKQNRL